LKANTSVRLLLLVVVATPAIAFWPKGQQDPGQADWTKHVRKACESRRYGIRLAAAKRVANGGDAAIAALTAYAKDKGQNAISSSLVDMIADAKVHQPKITALLTTWANDQSFYWRASAMRGLALRAGTAANEHGTWAKLFDRYTNDPAWLMRTHARFGAKLIGLSDTKQQPELDPRARVRLARMLLENGQVPSLQPLIDGLADKRMFLGIPWGARLGQESKKVLNRWLAADFPKLTGGNTLESIAAILAAAKKKSGQSLAMPKPLKVDDHGIIGGFEIASCKYGDQFVQWSADGTVRFGIDGSRTAKLPADKWQELLQQQSAIALDANAGVVVCDKLQMVVVDAKIRVDIAPMSMPEPASDWLKRLALRLEEANEAAIAAKLRRGLKQFEGQ
jgi:hypothetical protein